MTVRHLLLPSLVFLLAACKYDRAPSYFPQPPEEHYNTTPYNIDSALPSNFAPMQIPADNPLTKEGVSLGRRLFYDPILSGDNTQSCASCHQQAFGFTDGGKRFSTGIDGTVGTRNSMSLFNVGYATSFFWDGRASTLEEQALMPIQDPTEMKESLPNMVAELQAHPDYPTLFKKAFGSTTITPELIAKALAQFQRTLISGNSEYDKHYRKEGFMSDEAVNGYLLMLDLVGGDCLHCHSDGNVMWGNLNFENNGMDSAFGDLGLGHITGNPADNGLFKVMSLRNIEYTAPYMHDGRFATLEEVLDHYSEGLVMSPTVNLAKLEYAETGGVKLTQKEKGEIVAFLKALSDPDALSNPAYGPP